MPVSEYDDWWVYLDWKHKEEDKARRKAQNKSKGKTKTL